MEEGEGGGGGGAGRPSKSRNSKDAIQGTSCPRMVSDYFAKVLGWGFPNDIRRSMLVISPHVMGSVYRSCTKSLLPHFVLILIRRSEIEDKEVCESVLRDCAKSSHRTRVCAKRLHPRVAVLSVCIHALRANLPNV